MPHRRKTLEELRRQKAALAGPPLSDRSTQSLRNLKASLPGPPSARQPLAGGLDSVTNQAAVNRRIAQTPLPTARGVPRSRPGETQEQFAERLRKGGRTLESAVETAARQFQLDTQRQQRIADRQQRRDARDAQRRAAGLPTRDERRKETSRLIRERKGIFREDVNRRRRTLGLKPFGPVVRDEPIQIQSLDEVDPSVHGSGQDFDTPDGEMFRLVINSSGDQTLIPTRVDPNTGQRVIDTREIEIDEFKESLTDTEREVRRSLIIESGTLFARDLRAIQNNIAAIEKAKSGGTIAPQTALEQTEKLREDEAELMFQFDSTIGFGKAFLTDTAEDIAQQEAQVEAAETQRKEQEAKIKDRRKLAADILKQVISDAEGDKKKSAEAAIGAEVRRRMGIIDRLTDPITPPSQPVPTVSPGAVSATPTVAPAIDPNATPEQIAQQFIQQGAMPQETLPNGEAGFYSPVRSEVVSAKDIQSTADKRGMSVAQVMKALGILP